MAVDELRWSVEAGAARQLRADLPLAGGVLGACAAAWLVLAAFSMGEVNGAALAFSTQLALALAAACELALLAARALACARRGRVTLEYALDAHGLTLTERGRRTRSCALSWAEVGAARRTRDGLRLRAGRKELRVLCGERERAAIEAALAAARAGGAG